MFRYPAELAGATAGNDRLDWSVCLSFLILPHTDKAGKMRFSGVVIDRPAIGIEGVVFCIRRNPVKSRLAVIELS